MNEPILVSKKEAARVLSVSLRTIDNLIAAKELAVRRLGRRCLIPRRSLEDFARRDHSTTPVADSQPNTSKNALGLKNGADNLAQQEGGQQ